jgi:hypothetical protein
MVPPVESLETAWRVVVGMGIQLLDNRHHLHAAIDLIIIIAGNASP